MNQMKIMKNLIEKYWPVFIVGAYFALTCIYNVFGENYNVFWNTYIKTVRELFLIAFIYKSLSYHSNVLSVLFSLGAIAMSFGYMIFRFYCALKSINFDHYIELMKSTDNRLIMSIVIFCILASIKYIIYKNRG